MTFKKLTQAEKNKIRRKAMEAITDENYGDDGDNFHEHATAQAVISLLDELELKTEQRANWCAMAKKLGQDLDAAEKRIAELEAAPPAPVGEGETAVMPDYPGYVMTQRECFQAGKKAGIAEASNSPVIPDRYVLVPIEPTEEMIVQGFESEPDESFSDAAAWEAYDAMSGCQQAAHRAKLCWAAMIGAAPKPLPSTSSKE